MADVFISYSRSDRPSCTELRDALAELGVDVWFDAGIEPGHSFDREIERELAGSKAVLVLWSEASAASDWVRNEARTGKETGRLVAVQIAPCALPLEFRSNQADLLTADRPLAASPVWQGILRRIGDLIGRPGLAEFARLSAGGAGPDAWRRWIAAYPADPLVEAALARMIDAAAPDLRSQLAAERARRAALEAELADHLESAKAHSGEVASTAREIAQARRERDEAARLRADVETELAALRNSVAAGRGGKSLLSANVGTGIVLDQRLAVYVCLLLWVLALWFLSSSVGRLSDTRGGLGDVFWLLIGVVALVVPAGVVTAIILIKRRALAAAEMENRPTESAPQ